MKNDILFENSCLFADLVLFAILCYTLTFGVATLAGQIVVWVGILATALAFVGLCIKRMDAIDGRSHMAHMHA